jgi:hypothetical protein
MGELLSKFEPGELIGLVAVGGGITLALICAVTAILSEAWYKGRQLALKHEMLERGMTAEDIRTVIDAGTKRSAPGVSSVTASR